MEAPATADQKKRLAALSSQQVRSTDLAEEKITEVTPGPHFVVVLNNHHLSGLDALKSIRAEDVKEIRLVTETETVESSGAVEVVVTTIH